MELHAGAQGGSAIIFPVSDWFQPPGQFYQLLLTVFGRCKQYTIDSMVYMIGNEAARATGHLQAANKLFIDTSELKTNGIHGYPKTK